MKQNSWLTDSTFIESHIKSEVPLETVKLFLHHLNIFIKKLPINVLTTYDTVNDRIYCLNSPFSLTEFKEYIQVNTLLSYSFHDTTFLIEKALIKYFPQYSVIDQVPRELSSEEISEAIKNGEDPEEAFNKTKIDTETKTGIISKLWLMEDKFKIDYYVDDKYTTSEIRVCKLPWRDFSKTLTFLNSGIERQAYIQNNTILSHQPKLTMLEIDYEGIFLINFIKLNSYLGKILDLGGNKYKLGRFIFIVRETDPLYKEILAEIAKAY